MFSDSKSLIPRVGVASLSSPLEVGSDRAPKAVDDLVRVLEGFEFQVVELGTIDSPDESVAAGRKLAESHVHAVALAATSWFEDYLVVDLVEECNTPVFLWALPGMETGALCGTQQVSAYLKHLGVPYDGAYGPFESRTTQLQARSFLRASALKHRLRRARIGLAGHRVAGMTETSVSEFALKSAVGPRIVPLDLPHLIEAAKAVPEKEAARRWKELVRRAARCQVSEADGLGAIKFYIAIRELVSRHRLDALTIGCYPHLMGQPCLAASLLADHGIPLSCEGDVNGAVGQILLTLLTGQPTHNTDWLDPLEDGSVVFTHCGNGSLSLAEKPEAIHLASVRLMGQGVCVLFPAKSGPVTLVNLIPHGATYQLALLEGEALPTDMVFPGNPLRVRFECPTSQIIQWIYDEGIGHHWMAGYGHIGREIRQWAKMLGPDLRLISC